MQNSRRSTEAKKVAVIRFITNRSQTETEIKEFSYKSTIERMLIEDGSIQ